MMSPALSCELRITDSLEEIPEFSYGVKPHLRNVALVLRQADARERQAGPHFAFEN